MPHNVKPRWPSPPPPPLPAPVVRAPEPPPEPPRRHPWVHAFLSRAAELSLAVASCLLFFGGFLVILTAIFPEGTGFSDLIGSGNTKAASWRENRVGNLGGDGIEPGSARLTVITRGVSWKPASEIAWGPAETGLKLRERDGVQTSGRGEAVIAFDQAGEVRLGRNTMIIVREPAGTSTAGKRRSSLFVLEGELWGRFSPSQAAGSEIQLEASGSMARIAGGTAPSGAPGFKVSVSQDHRTTFAVYSGAAEIQTGNRTVRVQANQYATVDSNGVAATGSLPGTPKPLTPEAETRLRYRDVPPQVAFSWSAVDGIEAYRLVMARDSEFRKVMLDERMTRTEFVHGNLTEGPVFWRVSALRGEVEGAPSRARLVRLEQKGGGPPLSVQLPKGAVRSGPWTLAGETQPGTTVYIGGTPIPVDDQGRFHHEILLTPGAHVLVVEAVDALGNTSYASGVVNAR